MDERATETRYLEMVFPEDTNHYRTLFAGNGLSMMGKAAFIAATRYARQRMVLAKSERIEFKAPAREGELIELSARVTGSTEKKLQVEAELWAEEILTGARRLCISGVFTLVPVDETGQAVPLANP